MREDIVKSIAKQSDVTNVIILTFNIDLLFVESVLLRSLRKCGHPSLTIFADADEASRSFASQSSWVSGLGRRFRVVPVLSSKNATLLVGSGNLTFGGIRQNEEIWVRYNTETDGTSAFASFREYLMGVVGRIQMPGVGAREVAEAYDAETHPWARDMAVSGELLGRVGGERPLLEGVATELGILSPDRIYVSAPFFDEAGAALVAIAGRWPDASIEVLVQAGRTTLTQHGAVAAGPTVALKCIRSKRAADAKPFCHAKFYAFVSGQDVTLFAGSANCSAAALLSAGAAGNAELLSVQRMSREAFEGDVLGEIEIDAITPESLPSSVPMEEKPTVPIIRVLGASLLGPTLRIAYVCQGGWHPVRCDLDREQHVLREGLPSSGYFDLSVTSAPSNVILHADNGSTLLKSAPCWVDNEFVLSTTSRERQIAAGLAGNVQPSQWNLKTWTEVMRLLGEHLRYTPSTIPGALVPGSEGAAKDGAETKLAASRLFIDHYTLPSGASAPLFSDEDARILGLQHLLLDYFGVGLPDNDSDPTPETEADQTSTGDDDEAVDRPLQIPAKVPKPKPKREKIELTDAERKRAKKMAGQIVDRLVDPKFLENRPPARLKTDLTIAAVLFVCGVAEDWLPSDAFLELTYRAWISLFLDGQPAPVESLQQSGWLTRLSDRYEPSAFAAAMRSPELAASLATWGFLCPEGIAGVDAVRFHLASRVAVARLPWLWGVGQADEVAVALRRVMATAGRVDAGDEGAWEKARHRWDKMLAEGLALGALESFLLAQEGPAILKTRVTSIEIPRGTLLWQGRKIGFCVAMNNYRRDSAITVCVMSLTGDRAARKIQADFLLPLHGLIALANAGDNGLGVMHSAAISQFTTEMLELSAKANWSEDTV